MAWRCGAKSNAELIFKMKSYGIIRSPRVQEAMELVDRAQFVVDKEDAYEDSPQGIGHGATISAPHMHAYAAEHLLPRLGPGAKVLDVGSGSGYMVALLHHLVSPGGTVVGIDHIKELVDWSKDNLRRDSLGHELDSGQITMVAGDGRQGFPEDGPYDAIHVGAAAPTLPAALVEQLARPGRMFIPVGTSMQYIELIDKDSDGNVEKKRIMGVRYIPLTDRDMQLKDDY